jgi:hypothetical protein
VQAIVGSSETFDCAAFRLSAGEGVPPQVLSGRSLLKMEAFLVSTGIVALAEMGD